MPVTPLLDLPGAAGPGPGPEPELQHGSGTVPARDSRPPQLPGSAPVREAEPLHDFGLQDAEGRPLKPRPPPRPDAIPAAAASFRAYFGELRQRFLERDALITQIELALLAREHVLVTGAPGTAKSHLATAVLRRIVDPSTGRPSLFSRQLTESTVQTDMVGAVDFKVLTETGRTEHLTDEGMLGAHHAYLDEVFDARDMLLRSILNILHERELQHGRQVTRGKLECAIMTSNRYLSEVLQRSRETLLAFADRIAFVSFVPKGFVRPESKAAMLSLAAGGEGAALTRVLSLEELQVLQGLVDEVEIPGDVLEALARLTEQLERILIDRAVQRPEYTPTRYFSNRTLVKAVGVLRAAVVRARIFDAPGRAGIATLDDLALLRPYLILGGPRPTEATLLLDGAADPRERLQLESLALEHLAFDEALTAARIEGDRGATREADSLDLPGRIEAARRATLDFEPGAARDALEALAAPLVKGVRWSRNRRALEEAAARLAEGYAAHLRAHGNSASLGPLLQSDDRAGAVAAHRALAELIQRFAGASDVVPLFRERAVGYLDGALRSILDRLAAEDVALDAPALTQVADRALELQRELKLLGGEVERVLALPTADRVPRDEGLPALLVEVREQGAACLRRRTTTAFFHAPRALDPGLAPAERLHRDAELLAHADDAISGLGASGPRVREQILGARAGQLLVRELDEADGSPAGLFEVVRSLGAVFASEGIAPGPVYRAARDAIEGRLVAWMRRLPFVPAAQGPGSPAARLDPPAVIANRSRLPDNAGLYRSWAREHELALHREVLSELDAYLAARADPGAKGEPFLDPGVGRALAAAERAVLDARISFLRGYVAAVQMALPAPAQLATGEEAREAVAALRGSGLVGLCRQELELRSIEERLLSLRAAGAEVDELLGRLGEVEREVDGLCRELLARRSELVSVVGEG